MQYFSQTHTLFSSPTFFISDGWHYKKYTEGQTFFEYVSEFSYKSRQIQAMYKAFINFANEILELTKSFSLLSCFDEGVPIEIKSKINVCVFDVAIEELFFLPINTLITITK